MFEYDGTGVNPDGFNLIPDGWFPFQIFDVDEGTSKSGYQQVLVKAACMDSRQKDKTVWHWVTFLPKDNKGAGMALHFLKCIGQPHDGLIKVEPNAWKYQKFMGKVYTDTYNGKRNNKFEEISPFREEIAPLEEPLPAGVKASDEAEIPF